MGGIIYSHIKVGGYNSKEFTEWLEGLLLVMNPYPEVNSVLVIDNCHIHHVEGVEERCAQQSVSPIFCRLIKILILNSGVKLIYLPPYSTDLNPIEECFSYIKHRICRNGQEFRDIVEGGNKAAPYLFLYAALDTVTDTSS